MKKLFLLLLLVPSLVFAQGATHSVTLKWTASADSTTTTPGTVQVFRAVGACPASGLGTLTFTSLTSTASAAGPYVDSTVSGGTTYCYYVEAIIGSAESGASNTAGGVVPIAAPSGVTVVVQ